GAAGAGWSYITVHPARTVRPPADGCGRRVPPATGRAGAGAGSPLSGTAEPLVEQGAAQRGRARQRGLLRLAGRGEPLRAHTTRLGDLVLLEGELCGVRRPGAVSEHQRAREGPGLAAHVLDLLDGDPDLLGDLAGHRVLEALARLDES